MVNRIYTNEKASEMQVYSSCNSLYITIKPDDMVDGGVIHELDEEDIKVLIIDLQEHLLKIQQS